MLNSFAKLEKLFSLMSAESVLLNATINMFIDIKKGERINEQKAKNISLANDYHYWLIMWRCIWGFHASNGFVLNAVG